MGQVTDLCACFLGVSRHPHAWTLSLFVEDAGPLRRSHRNIATQQSLVRIPSYKMEGADNVKGSNGIENDGDTDEDEDDIEEDEPAMAEEEVDTISIMLML